MSYTVAGTFDSAADAQKAQSQLISAGIAQSRIDVSMETQQGATSQGATRSSDNSTDGDGQGTISGFFAYLCGSGDDEQRDNRSGGYAYAARTAAAIVTVHADNNEDAHRAASLLDEYCADDIDERAAEFYAKANEGHGNQGHHDQTRLQGQQDTTLKVIREDRQVGKREVETGGVRLHSKIVERPVEEQVRLRSEHVRIERVPVDRPATEADFNTF